MLPLKKLVASLACLTAVEALPEPAALDPNASATTSTWLHHRIAPLHDRLQQTVALRRAFHALPVAAVASSTDFTASR